MTEAVATGIKLNWRHSQDGDLSHYNIYRSEESEKDMLKLVKQLIICLKTPM